MRKPPSRIPDIRRKDRQDLPSQVQSKTPYTVEQALKVAVTLVGDNDQLNAQLRDLGPGREAYTKRNRREDSRTYVARGGEPAGRPRHFSYQTVLALMLWLVLYKEQWRSWNDMALTINAELSDKQKFRIGIKRDKATRRPATISRHNLARRWGDICVYFGRDHESDRCNPTTGEMTVMPHRGDIVDLLAPLLRTSIEMAGLDPDDLSGALDATRMDSHTTLRAAKRHPNGSSKSDPDAKSGHRTVTPRHPEEITFGANLDLITAIPREGGPMVAPLVFGGDLTADAAGAFKASGTFAQYPGGRGHALLEQMHRSMISFRELAVDRGYSESPDFRDATCNLDIRLIRDFKLLSASKWMYGPEADLIQKAGSLYPSCTPRNLLEAVHPDSLSNQPDEQQRMNNQLWQELQKWQMQPLEKPKRRKDGALTQRFRGPHLAGKVKRSGVRLPKYASYKEHAVCAAEHAEKQACAATVTVTSRSLRDLLPHSFGSEEHKASYNRRTAVEMVNRLIRIDILPERVRLRTIGRKRLLWLCYLVARNVLVTRRFAICRGKQDPWAVTDATLNVTFPKGCTFRERTPAEEPLHRLVFPHVLD